MASTTLRESMVCSRPVSTSLISVSQPVRVRCVETALYPLRTRPLGEAVDDLVHRLPDQGQKLACAAQRHRAFSRFHKLFGKRMISQCRKLAVGWSGKAVGEGESSTVGVDAPAADGPLPNGARLLHHRDALF